MASFGSFHELKSQRAYLQNKFTLNGSLSILPHQLITWCFLIHRLYWQLESVFRQRQQYRPRWWWEHRRICWAAI